MTARVRIILLMAILAFGCDRERSKPASASSGEGVELQAELQAEIQKVRSAAADAAMAGNAEEARRILNEAITDPRYADFAPILLVDLLQGLVDADDFDGATALLEKHALGHPGFVLAALGTIDRFGLRTERQDALAEWYTSLLGLGLSEGTVSALLSRLAQFLGPEAEPEQFGSLFALATEHLPEEACATFAQRLMEGVKSRPGEGVAIGIIEYMERTFGDHPAMKIQTYLARIDLQIRDGKVAEALAALTDASIALSPQDASGRAASIVDQAVRMGTFDIVDTAVAAFPDLAARATDGRLRYHVEQGQLAEAERLLFAKLDALPESSLPRHFAALVEAHATRGQHADVDRFIMALTAELPDEHRMQLALAGAWVASAMTQEDYGTALDRMEKLVDRRGLPSASVAQRFRDYFYKIAVREKKAELARLAALAVRLRSEATEDMAQQAFANLALDAAFMAEDYDSCLATLAKGVPGYDEAWTVAMSAKIGAHKALAEGDDRAAAQGFRAFMEYLALEADDLQDPVAGGSRPREEILGFNAARIGDLLTKAGDTDDAAAAYAEARTLYETAAGKVDAGSDDLARIQKAIADLASGATE
ncbi:MAG: hypothetical protein O2923_06600 [Verrucomicrobia bacterium]|nr:hypothetical protein [Verrucomicrobiota bacterium]MDA1087631.1 hypothetical protein [Verrucomicrobiota bacterium]